jgi:hypothetical protein
MKKYIFSFLLVIFTSFVMAVKITDMPKVMKPGFMQVDGDDLFIVDGGTFSIQVYSLKDFSLKFSLGKKGAGPGEFMHFPQLNGVYPDYLLCSGGWKTIKFSREGMMISEKTFQPFQGLNLKPVKDNFVAIAYFDDMKTRISQKILYITNSKYERIKEIYPVQADSNRFTLSDTGNEEFKVLTHYFHFLTYDDKIFVADSRKGFVIAVFDSNGNNLYTIDKKIEPVKVQKYHKEKLMENLRLSYPNIIELRRSSAFTFYENFPPIRHFWIDSYKIYVTTYKEKDDRHEMIILDLKGNILERIFLELKSTKAYKVQGEFDTHTVHEGVLYELVEDEDREVWELHKTNISDYIKK